MNIKANNDFVSGSPPNKCYNIILNTQDSNAALFGTNKARVSFSVNLISHLPIQYKAYMCSFSLFSAPSDTAFSDCGIINIDFANTEIYENGGKCRNIGVLYPRSYAVTTGQGTSNITTKNYYNVSSCDNMPFVLYQPYSTQQITVSFYNWSTIGTNTTAGLIGNGNMPHWIMNMQLIPITDF